MSSSIDDGVVNLQQLNKNSSNEYYVDLKIHFETSNSKEISLRGTNTHNTPPKPPLPDNTSDIKLQMIA